MIYRFGPRAQRVYAALRASILTGERVVGDQLPSHVRLAEEFGVAPLTVRQVLSQLETEGLVAREHGRGTFIRARTTLAVLIVDDEPVSRTLLREQVRQNGYHPIEAADAGAALGILQIQRVALVLSDIRMPHAADGVAFIRAVRHSWPDVPLAAVTSYAEDLADLLGTPYCPLLILSKPVRADHLKRALHLVVSPPETLATAS
jgi:CheY-like chemotaxis protein